MPMGDFRRIALIHVEEVSHRGSHDLLARVVGLHGHKAAKHLERTTVPEFNYIVMRGEPLVDESS